MSPIGTMGVESLRFGQRLFEEGLLKGRQTQGGNVPAVYRLVHASQEVLRSRTWKESNLG